MASGERIVDLAARTRPFRIGRSRNQALVIDWAHEDVSGHHVDLAVEPTPRVRRSSCMATTASRSTASRTRAGTQFRWQPGQTMRLGRAVDDEPECTLTLSRAS